MHTHTVLSPQAYYIKLHKKVMYNVQVNLLPYLSHTSLGGADTS